MDEKQLGIIVSFILVFAFGIVTGGIIKEQVDISFKSVEKQIKKAETLCGGKNNIKSFEISSAQGDFSVKDDEVVSYGDVTCKDGSYYNL